MGTGGDGGFGGTVYPDDGPVGKIFGGVFAGARMYMLGAVVVGTIFFMLQAKMRLSWVKMLILCLAMGVDIFFGARYIVDMLF